MKFPSREDGLTKSPADSTRKSNSVLWTPLLAIASAAFAVEIPFFFFGTPSGHDVEFHLYSWLEVLSQWKHGILYPRWAALAHFGFGEPRFVFYPPASWTLGAAISAIFPWTIASPVYIWIVLTLAGISMFVLMRRWLDRRDTIFAAVLYAVNPYHLVIVYWRSAFAELLAACLVPLLLLFMLRAAEGERRAIIPLGLVLAGAWLTNAPAAVMIHYSVALLAVLFAWQRQSMRILLIAAGAVALGACLASFYLLPAIYEQKWVNIADAVSQGSRPQDNFLFIHTGDTDHDAFNRIVSWLGALEIAVTLLGASLAKSWRRTNRDLWNSLLGWTLACGALMFSVTALVWRILPKMQFMQFPWRWLLCLSMLFTVFVTVGLQRWWMRGAVCALSLLVIVLAWHHMQSPWWDDPADLREMQDNMYTGAGYEGVEEYTPAGVDPSAADKDARRVTIEGQAHGALRIVHWGDTAKTFVAEMSGADQLAVKLFPYPAWEIKVNGRDITAGERTGSGQMLVPVQAGVNRVEIRFVRTWDRTIGWWISVATALLLLVWLIISGRSATARA